MALGTLSSTTQRKPYQRGFGQPQQPAAAGTMAQPQYQRGLGQAPAMGQSAPSAPLQAPQPMTQNGALAQQKNLQGLQTGQFGDVQSAQKATDRAGMLRQYQAIQLSRGNAARGNLSAEQAQRAQDQSLAAANSQNLTAQNSVNALQRQYGQDALNRADTYEKEAYSRGTNERGYQDSRADLGYDRATDESRYGDSRADVQYGRDYQAGRDAVGDQRYTSETEYSHGRDAVGDQRYDTEYADKRGDVQYNRGIDESRYADTRSDVQYGKEYQAGRDAVGDQRYDQSYADQRGDVQYQRGYQENRDAVGDMRYTDETAYGRSRDAVGDARYSDETQYSRSRDAVGDARYDDTTQYDRSRDAVGDQRYDQATAYSQGRDAVADQRYDASTAYSQSRDAVGDQRYDASTAYSQGRDALSDSRYADETSYSRSEASRLEGKGDVNALIASVTDPRAQNLLRGAQARGEDVQALYSTITQQGTANAGTIGEDYRSANEAEKSLQAKIDELKASNPLVADEKGWTRPQDQYDAQIREQASRELAAEKAVADGATKDAALGRSVTQKLSNGTQLTPDEKAYAVSQGLVNKYSASTIPTNTKANELKGQQVNIDGQVYTVLGGSNAITGQSNWGNDTHTDYTILDRGGQKVYVYGGKVNDAPPKEFK